MHTRQAYPGIEDRTAFLEKSSQDIKERLTQELSNRQGTDTSELVEKLMFGDRTLAPNLLPADDALGLISLELVREGAKILQEIAPEMLFPKDEGWEGWCLSHFEEWRDLYLAADEKNEEILVALA